jgi:peptidoglycan/xylan/chitin deacetylase (PgdA/CDA1 family)
VFGGIAHGIQSMHHLVISSIRLAEERAYYEERRAYYEERRAYYEQKRVEEYLWMIDPNQPMVALTFDDGPTGYTLQILDILEQHHSRGTFFVFVSMVERHQDIILQTHARDNEVLGHSWSHGNFTRMSYEQIVSEITRTHDVITAVVGKTARLHRPPFGSINSTVTQASESQGFAMIAWGIDPRDWATTDYEQVYDFIMEEIEPGMIVVLHDTRPSTVSAMELVIPALVGRGYQLVTVSQLLYYQQIELQPGVVYGWSW